jgi:hypothetical protein
MVCRGEVRIEGEIDAHTTSPCVLHAPADRFGARVAIALSSSSGTAECAPRSSARFPGAKRPGPLLRQQRVPEALDGPLDHRDDHLLVDVVADFAALDSMRTKAAMPYGSRSRKNG